MSANIQSWIGRRAIGFGVATALLLFASPQLAAAEQPAAPGAATVEAKEIAPRARFSLFKRAKARAPAPVQRSDRQGEISLNPPLNPMLTAPLEMPLGERRQRLLPTYG